MQTTCPECRTTFRVSQDHLGARRGLVRCGTCNAVFNAYDTLLPELEEAPVEGVAANSAQISEAGLTAADHLEDHPRGIGRNAVEILADTTDRDRAAPVEPSSIDTDREDVAVEAVESLPAVVAADESIATLQESQPDILLRPLWEKPAKQPRSWKSVFKAGLAVLLVGLLLLQTVYFLRAELAAFAPNTRPALEWLCQPLNCQVPLPRQLTQDAISSSSLEHDLEQKSRVRLTFMLTNRTGQTQAWPQIMLTLSDVREAPVAQQVFRPQTYLPKDVKISAGMPAGGEREIRLDLDIGNLVASGYALRLAYP